MSDSEEIKISKEIEKLEIEIGHLKHPFSRPSTWIPMMLAVAGFLTAYTQFQKSDLEVQASALNAEKAEFSLVQKELEFAISSKSYENQLNASKEKLELSEEARRTAETDVKRLLENKSSLEKDLNGIRDKIEAGKLVLSALTSETDISNAGDEVKALGEEFATTLRVIGSDVQEALDRQAEIVSTLLSGANSDDQAVRVESTRKLVSEFSASKLAIEAALSWYQLGSIEELTTSGRINLLVYLGNTDRLAWDRKLHSMGRDALNLIEERQNIGIKIGPTTREKMNAFDKLLSTTGFTP